MQTQEKKLVTDWYRRIIYILLVLCSIYLVPHFLYKGGTYTTLSGTDITSINLLLTNNYIANKDTDKNLNSIATKPVNEKAQANSLKKLVFNYIYSKYSPLNSEDSIRTINYLSKFDKATFATIVSQHPFKCKSFFWLINGGAYLEILFWSLLGLICSLLYNVSEAIASPKRQFKENELFVHWAKLIYTPFIALVIYLAMDILTFDKEINISKFGNGLIVFSFILGFFSRRAIDLLEKIKDIILPGKDREPETLPEVTDEIATPEIIEEAIKEMGEEWINSFPNVTGLSVRNKMTQGKDTGDCALVLKVIKKDDSVEFGQIPEYITYTGKIDGKRYRIKTDVVQEDIPKPHIAKKDDEPFELGISISREYDNETGTIGLFLEKRGNPGKKYIISCYHVFCAPELRMNNKNIDINDKSCLLRCASYQDDGTNIIGWVLKGKIDAESDFAIAELKEDIQFTNKFYLPESNNITPKGFKPVIPEDKNRTVKMCGRTSEYKEGVIKSHYASQTINYGNNRTQYIKGLVEITSISKGGDSGAPVLLNDTNEIIGLVVCGNTDSTYVLPVYDFIDNNDYKLY